ncbi:glycosyltransferase family 4 protein [Pontibacter liquoris]|uniref:glycosyltransferase family 4 protein n=1 Tax=Pontibacter liquoris TaxID=2905677 RepID=UPI001FA7AE49|nr:glycosyltransferase family 4 protein [Pontibacter liquoris]
MAGLKLMLLNYWGLDDPLTQATTLLHSQALKQMRQIDKVVLVTIERENREKQEFTSTYYGPCYQLYSKGRGMNLLTKAGDFIRFPKELQRIARKERIDTIVAVGTLAGSLALGVSKALHIPIYITFFEPHAAYMLDTGVWKEYDPRYIFQKRWERMQASQAAGLITVSEQYKAHLMALLPNRTDQVQVVRNGVDGKTFAYNQSDRTAVRERLGLPEASLTGIYVGKYGDLYYKQEAFAIYKQCFDSIPGFRLLILSPQSENEILDQLQQHQIDSNKVYIACVPHQHVPQYLSAADFAFATIKAHPSARFCSPVKIGEYWASGLPVLLTEGVGDDSEIIRNEGGGAVFNLQQEGSVAQALDKILLILQNPGHRQEIPLLTRKYRSPERIREAYAYFFGHLSTTRQV